MRQVENMLWQTCSLDDTANLDRAFLLDELPDRVEKRGGELDCKLASGF